MFLNSLRGFTVVQSESESPVAQRGCTLIFQLDKIPEEVTVTSATDFLSGFGPYKIWRNWRNYAAMLKG